ncbi:MAG: protein kinase [Armatimonadetes bacterium]|nr:protein kinase [Anaerolineae bacterium]
MSKKGQESNSALVGSTMGQYRLEQMLASGGMARIYKATDTNLDRIVAVKVLMRELIDMDDSMIERFEREAKAVAALEHDSIIRIYDYRRHDDLYYIVMNYVEGYDLADLLNQYRREGKFLEIDRALKIMMQVAAALDFAHAAGIIHRDVKPSNVLLDKNDKATLTDFGLVLRQSVDKTLGTAFGTPRYISPEQALASEKSVPQSDVYSLAVVMYEILTGDMLFKADTPMQIALSHISEPPPKPRSINPNIPEAVEVEILKAHAKDPLSRHRTATEFINAVRAAYGTSTPATAPALDARTLVFTDTPEVRQAVVNRQPLTPPASKTPILSMGVKGKPATPESAAVLAQWDDAPAAAVTAPSRKLPLPLVAGGLGALGVIAVLALVLLRGGSSPSLTLMSGITQPPRTTAPATPVGTPPPATADGIPLTLRYDSTTLIVYNRSADDVDISQLTLGKPGADAAVLGAEVRQAMIEAGECLSITQVSRAYNLRDWDCTVEQDKVEVASQDLFWRTVQPDQFEVRLADQVIAVCATVRRGAAGECTVNLP